MLLCVASIAVLYYRDRERADCMERYNEASSKISLVRADAADARAEALASAMKASVDGPATIYRAEAQRYLDQYEQEKRTREANPLTPPPSDYCS